MPKSKPRIYKSRIAMLYRHAFPWYVAHAGHFSLHQTWAHAFAFVLKITKPMVIDA